MGKDLRGKELGEGLSQRKDGYYIARYTNKRGKRIQKAFKTRQDAKRWLRDSLYDNEHCCAAAGEGMTVDTCYQLWVDDEKVGKVRDSTLRRYEANYKLHIKPVIGDLVISEVKPLQVQAIINKMQKGGMNSRHCSLARTVTGMIFDFAMRNDLIVKNPCRSVKLPPCTKKEPRVLLIKEQTALLDACEDEDKKSVFRFALNTGMRSGEIRGLKWEDIDFEKRQIKVQRTICDTKGGFTFNEPKTESGKRIIPMTSGAYQVLVYWKDKKKSNKVIPMEYAGLIFLNKNKPYRGSNMDAYLEKQCSKLGIQKCSMHSLRHTYATRFIESGGSPKMLQSILGHSKISMTMDLYVHATDEQKALEVKKLEEYMKLVQNW